MTRLELVYPGFVPKIGRRSLVQLYFIREPRWCTEKLGYVPRCTVVKYQNGERWKVMAEFKNDRDAMLFRLRWPTYCGEHSNEATCD